MKSTPAKAVKVRSASGDYVVLCQRGILERAEREIARLGRFSSIHILTSPKVWKALGKEIRRGMPEGFAKHVHQFDDAEEAKNLQTVEKISRALVRTGADRKALLVAVGGGVVGDVVGFAAASYLRGVQLVQVPTTLVAQVIKYGVIADPKLFAFLESGMDAILRRDARALEHVIRRSIEIKARVVGKDERESGLREILNFGHTFGHALESATRYRRFQHGEAVAWGMMCAGLLGHEVTGTPADAVSRIVTLVRRIGPLPEWPETSAKRLLQAMHADKKTREGKLRFVLAPRIGEAETFDDVPEKKVECILRCAPQFFARPLKALGKCDA